MKRKNDQFLSGKKPRLPGLSAQDVELWRAFTKDIEPYAPRDADDGSVPVLETVRAAAPAVREAPQAPKKIKNIPDRSLPPQLDGRTEQRLRRGQIPIEGTLDLHGLTQHEAHERLNDFILKCHGQGRRCVLVITGKGLGRVALEEQYEPDKRGGILRQKLPLWLSLPPLKFCILRFVSAVPKHGGSGAWYVYLKRERFYESG